MEDDEIDFYEVRFADEAILMEARKHLVVHAVLGSGGCLVSSAYMEKEAIEKALAPMAAAGVTFSVSDSGITTEDMWPTWPEDGDDDDEDDEIDPAMVP